MRTITGTKIGNMVNISIDGKLKKKVCGSPEEANELFNLVLKAKNDPSDENVKTIRCYLNEKLRVALMAGLESDSDSGEIYLAGFNTPVPMKLVEVIKDYCENGFPVEAIINFWKLLMINPDKRVRTSAFDFIVTHDFVLTDKGYMVVYKAVKIKKEVENDLSVFLSNQYLHVKKDWNCSPNKYVVYRDEDNRLGITKAETAENWDDDKNVTVLGFLGELYKESLTTDEENGTLYTDKHTKQMAIVLGKPVYMPRTECDGDPAIECSYGLHVGATKYVENFANDGDAILVCLVNPANIVAVPAYDNSKMRVTEYFPFAVATYTNGKIDIIEQSYFEDDYCDYEAEELENQIVLVQAGELPIESAINAEVEERPMDELLKILETRLVDLS